LELCYAGGRETEIPSLAQYEKPSNMRALAEASASSY
jgi:hypothetical protein